MAENTPMLGKIVADDEKLGRDAVHVAIAPVIAAECLIAGEHVGLLADGTASTHAAHIGIVDPFLAVDVMAGQRFWLLLYPGTITDLRHVWTHPAFRMKIAEDFLAKWKAQQMRSTNEQG